MAYKYQLGESTMSGSLTQEGDVDLSGSVSLALPGQAAAVRGGLTVVEDSLFSSMLQIDGTLDCNSTSDFQGNANFQAKVTFNGAQVGNVTSVTSATYTIVATDYFIAANSTSNAITITMPAASSHSGRVLKIKDVGGNADSNNITIDGNSSETIDGAASIVLESPHAGVTLLCNGTSWFVL
jgi:hypothetical protein|tara:strand:- start:20 stop:565 length:546 start_codon:yes stop_codon:yes gene_type:complete